MTRPLSPEPKGTHWEMRVTTLAGLSGVHDVKRWLQTMKNIKNVTQLLNILNKVGPAVKVELVYLKSRDYGHDATYAVVTAGAGSGVGWASVSSGAARFETEELMSLDDFDGKIVYRANLSAGVGFAGYAPISTLRFRNVSIRRATRLGKIFDGDSIDVGGHNMGFGLDISYTAGFMFRLPSGASAWEADWALPDRRSERLPKTKGAGKDTARLEGPTIWTSTASPAPQPGKRPRSSSPAVTPPVAGSSRFLHPVKTTPALPSASLLSPNYVTHTIQAGDRVWNLAPRYGATDRRTFTQAVADANPGIDFHGLRPGQKILVPVAPSVERAPAPSGADLIHEIASGQMDNRFRLPDVTLGQSLPAQIRRRPPSASAAPTGFMTHTLQPKERLGDLGIFYGFPDPTDFMDRVRHANPGLDLHHARPGTRIKVPVAPRPQRPPGTDPFGGAKPRRGPDATRATTSLDQIRDAWRKA